MRAKKHLITIALVFFVGVSAGRFLQKDQNVSAEKSNDPINYMSKNELPKLNQSPLDYVFQVKTQKRSYFALDETGQLIPKKINGKKYYKVDEKNYNLSRNINTNRTVLIVMDPWEDSGSSFLNSYFEKIIRKKLIPLVNKSIALGIPVVVLTDSPLDSQDYSNKVSPEIEELAKKGKLLIVYHQSTDSHNFSVWLRSMGIDTLIYSGFASNMCVIGRELGMIHMRNEGFRLFFVPEASAAIEFQETWKNQAIHKSTSVMVSQWIGELIKLKDFLSVQETLQN